MAGEIPLRLRAQVTPTGAGVTPGIAGTIRWTDGVVCNFTAVGGGCDLDTAETPADYGTFTPPSQDARAACMRANGRGAKPLDYTKILATCSRSSAAAADSCTVEFPVEFCEGPPLVVTELRIADGFADPWTSGDSRIRALATSATATRSVNMALSEVFWVRCGTRETGVTIYTFGVNGTEAARKIANARRRLREVKYSSLPPHMVTMVMDSVSRPDWFRSFQPLVQELRELERSGRSEVYEFFRHSSVGWGTNSNVPAMLTGASAVSGGSGSGFSYNETDPLQEYEDNRMFVPMGEFLRSVGYVVLGQEAEYMSEELLAHGEVYETWFNHAVKTNMRGCFLGRHQLDMEIELFLRMNLYYEHIASDVPRYFAVHSGANHGSKADNLMGQSASFVQLFNTVDLSTTIVTLASDHGKYDRDIFGLNIFEQNNPLWVWVLPPGFVDAVQRKTLLENGQVLTTHYDTHYTMKNILNRYAAKETLAAMPAMMCGDPLMNQYCKLEFSTKRGTPIPPWFHPGGHPATVDTVSYATDLINTRLPTDRSCTDAASPISFCSCASISKTLKHTEHVRFKAAVTAAVAELNTVTGDGQLLCRNFSATDFEIVVVVQVGLGYRMEIKERSGLLKLSVSLGESRMPRIGKTKYGQKMVMIKRLDRFSDECCLNDVEDKPPTFNKRIAGFDADPEANMPWTQPGYKKQHPRLYLRLCRCAPCTASTPT